MAGRKKHRTRVVGSRLYRKQSNHTTKPMGLTQETLSEADRILAESLMPNFVTHASPTGQCLDCGRYVTGERKLCGQCLNKHEEQRLNK